MVFDQIVSQHKVVEPLSLGHHEVTRRLSNASSHTCGEERRQERGRREGGRGREREERGRGRRDEGEMRREGGRERERDKKYIIQIIGYWRVIGSQFNDIH